MYLMGYSKEDVRDNIVNAFNIIDDENLSIRRVDGLPEYILNGVMLDSSYRGKTHSFLWWTDRLREKNWVRVEKSNNPLADRQMHITPEGRAALESLRGMLWELALVEINIPR